MKIITLTQPWATLMVLGHKTVETRSWGTKYRGPVAIHAAKGWKPPHEQFAIELARRKLIPYPDNLPFGAIVCAVDLTDVVKMTPEYLLTVGSELEFGHYELGRVAWLTKLLEVAKPPHAWTGGQGLRNLDDDIAKQVFPSLF